jgi:hypothetical protein
LRASAVVLLERVVKRDLHVLVPGQ